VEVVSVSGREPMSQAVLSGSVFPEFEPQAIQGLLSDLTGLLESATGPEAFHGVFLHRVVTTLGACGGALWQQGTQGRWEVQQQHQLETLGLDQVHGWDAHAGLLQVAARRGKALWVLPHGTPAPVEGGLPAANLTGLALLFAPVTHEHQVVGLVEIWFGATPEGAQRRLLGQLLTELAGFVAAFLHKARWRDLTAQRQLWEKLESFSLHIHASLDPREVSYLVANEARQLLECDQVAVALDRGSGPQIEAVSGAPGVEARSEVVRALAGLCGSVLRWGEPLVYDGTRDASLPAYVLGQLDDYLARSNSRVLLVLPLRSGNPAESRAPNAALVSETFAATPSAEQLRGRAAILGKHAASALANALAHQQFPLRWLARPLAALQQATTGRGPTRLAVAALAVVVLTSLLVLIPTALRLEAKGNLLPQQRQIVYAPLSGKIVDLKAQPGDVMDKGQELLFIEDLDTQLQVDQLAIKIGAAEQRLAFLGDQLGRNSTPEKQDTLLRDRIDQEFELRKLLAERDILLQASRTPRKAAVPSPLAGKVVTYDAQETLLGKTVKPGDPLLRVAQVHGCWEVLLYVPEGSITPIREGLARAGGALDVDLLLHSHPHRTYKGRLLRSGLGGETTTREQAVVVPVTVQIVDGALLPQLPDMPVGVEVRAKIDCGAHPVGYVWFYELWDFVYEHILF
jgi:biotin carboxyl carrier protein